MLLGSLFAWVVLTSGCILLQPLEPSDQVIENITAEEAFDLIQANKDNPDFVILDVRTPEEFASGHIENAINLDFLSETFREDLDQLDKSKTYLMHCRSGARSAQALSVMEELGFLEVHHMADGILGWEAEGFPTVPSL
jgi:DNA phosphorothioation-dependent restriction protein DptG